MSHWIFLNDFDVIKNSDQALNLNFVTHFILRIEDKEIVIFFSGNHDDPHVLRFDTTQACQKAYNILKDLLRQSN